MPEDDTRKFLQPTRADTPTEETRLGFSPGLVAWLLRHRLSLACTSHNSGRLVSIGVGPGDRLSVNEQDYVRATGLHWHDGALYVASLFQIWKLTNMLRAGEFANGAYDAVLVPRLAHVTGYVDAHDVAVGREGEAMFVASLYSCLAATDDRSSFRPLWTPPFITQIVPEDRCHLNGLAMDSDEPAYATAVGAQDVARGWRANRGEGGLLLDIRGNRIVSDSLSMPHSPRLHQGRLYLLDSGTGYLVTVDQVTGERTNLAFCPGFARGLALFGNHAVVGLSLPREQGFADLPLQAELDRRGLQPWCGLAIFDLTTGALVERLHYTAGISELFGVTLLPEIRNPVTIGPASEEILSTIRPALP
jgi:uncharacterized protein (TIGR03032 family)